MANKAAFIALLVFFISATSCNTTMKTLCRNWKVREVYFDPRNSSFSLEQQRMIINQLTTKYYFELKKDSMYQTRNGTDVVNGKWWLIKNGKAFHTDNGELGATDSDIVSLSKTEFVFESLNTNGEKMKFVCVPADIK